MARKENISGGRGRTNVSSARRRKNNLENIRGSRSENKKIKILVKKTDAENLKLRRNLKTDDYPIRY